MLVISPDSLGGYGLEFLGKHKERLYYLSSLVSDLLLETKDIAGLVELAELYLLSSFISHETLELSNIVSNLGLTRQADAIEDGLVGSELLLLSIEVILDAFNALVDLLNILISLLQVLLHHPVYITWLRVVMVAEAVRTEILLVAIRCSAEEARGHFLAVKTCLGVLVKLHLHNSACYSRHPFSRYYWFDNLVYSICFIKL